MDSEVMAESSHAMSSSGPALRIAAVVGSAAITAYVLLIQRSISVGCDPGDCREIGSSLMWDWATVTSLVCFAVTCVAAMLWARVAAARGLVVASLIVGTVAAFGAFLGW